MFRDCCEVVDMVLMRGCQVVGRRLSGCSGVARRLLG